LEPVNPPNWPQYWRVAGFTALARYTSAISSELGKSARDLRHAAQRFARSGIKVSHLQMANYESELRKIYRISLRAFANNFLYSPLAENEFLDLYASIKAYIRPELVLLAEDEQGPLAFLFTVPDILQQRRGESIDTVVIKTVAAIPSVKTQGLGTFLVAQAMSIYDDLGYRSAIHAMMHEHNASQNVSRHQANVRTIRRYCLFAKPLGSQT
jgi:GNAT superfamily N-acetyltransferase